MTKRALGWQRRHHDGSALYLTYHGIGARLLRD